MNFCKCFNDPGTRAAGVSQDKLVPGEDSDSAVQDKGTKSGVPHSGGTERGRNCYHGDRLTGANKTSKFSSSSETGSRRRIQNRPRIQMTALNCDNTRTSKTTSVAARTLLLRRSTAVQLLLLPQ